MPKSVVSDVSEKSASASASARSPKMGDWEKQSRPPIVHFDVSEEDAVNSTIHELLKFSLPRSLFEIDPAIHIKRGRIHSFLTSVQKSKGSVAIDDDDPLDIVFQLDAFSNLVDITDQYGNVNVVEANQLHSIIPLLARAFRRGEDPKFPRPRVERESEICLTSTGPGLPTKAKTDFYTICENRSLWTSVLFNNPNLHKVADLLWQADIRLVQFITLLLFPGEGKRIEHDQNKNQLIYDLCTCLHQQESLGLPLKENFGFVLSNRVVKIYGMKNPDDKVDPHYKLLEYHFATFDVRQPLEFLKLYSFLCKLADHLETEIMQPFRNLQRKDIKKHLQKRESWRADDTDSGNDQRRSGGGGGEGAGGGGSDGGGGGGDSGDSGGYQGGSGGAGHAGTGGFSAHKRGGSMGPPDAPTAKRRKEHHGGGAEEADECFSVPALDDSSPEDAWPHERSSTSTSTSHTPEPHWDEPIQPHDNAGVLSPPWTVDTRPKDEPVGQPSLPLSVDNLKAHTKRREGSIDVLSFTSMSTSSRL
ncbi:hypothetical protein OF83DRAFT_90529 [Amylostereum chailletii]|nr:hypothetical protein OF83DRAFT_90529 [Amylostereum chailletii]